MRHVRPLRLLWRLVASTRENLLVCLWYDSLSCIWVCGEGIEKANVYTHTWLGFLLVR